MGCWEWCALFSFLLFRARALCTRAVAAHMRAAPYLKAPRLATPPLPPPPIGLDPRPITLTLTSPTKISAPSRAGAFMPLNPTRLRAGGLSFPPGSKNAPAPKKPARGEGEGGS
jgi:hypothetical protein